MAESRTWQSRGREELSLSLWEANKPACGLHALGVLAVPRGTTSPPLLPDLYTRMWAGLAITHPECAEGVAKEPWEGGEFRSEKMACQGRWSGPNDLQRTAKL